MSEYKKWCMKEGYDSDPSVWDSERLQGRTEGRKEGWLECAKFIEKLFPDSSDITWEDVDMIYKRIVNEIEVLEDDR